MKINELKKIRAGIDKKEMDKNSSFKVNADRPADRYGRSRDIYTREDIMREDDRVKWFGGIAATGCVPFAGFLLKAFGDDRIVNFIKKAPEDTNILILFAHVDEERQEVNAVSSNIIVKYHRWTMEENGKEVVFPEYVHFKYTHTYRCEMEEWLEDPEAVLKKVWEKGLPRR